jgi:hypothetical protein
LDVVTAQTRTAQGLPEKITDPSVLSAIATLMNDEAPGGQARGSESHSTTATNRFGEVDRW